MPIKIQDVVEKQHKQEVKRYNRAVDNKKVASFFAEIPIGTKVIAGSIIAVLGIWGVSKIVKIGGGRKKVSGLQKTNIEPSQASQNII